MKIEVGGTYLYKCRVEINGVAKFVCYDVEVLGIEGNDVIVDTLVGPKKVSSRFLEQSMWSVAKKKPSLTEKILAHRLGKGVSR